VYFLVDNSVVLKRALQARTSVCGVNAFVAPDLKADERAKIVTRATAERHFGTAEEMQSCCRVFVILSTLGRLSQVERNSQPKLGVRCVLRD
jgi:hypothetical protein